MNFIPLSVTFYVLSILHEITKKKNALWYQLLKGLSDFDEMRYRRFNWTWEQVQWKACFTVKPKRNFWPIFITFLNPILGAFCTGCVLYVLFANFVKIGRWKPFVTWGTVNEFVTAFFSNLLPDLGEIRHRRSARSTAKHFVVSWKSEQRRRYICCGLAEITFTRVP